MTDFPFPSLTPEDEATFKLFPTNVTRMLLHTQGLTLPYLKFSGAFRDAKISPTVRERVIARVGAVTGSEYELQSHHPEVLRTGTSEALLGAITDPSCHDFDDPALAVLMAYVDSAVHDHGAKEETLSALREHFPDNEVAEITLLAGQYLMTAVFLKSLSVPLDAGPPNWSASESAMKEA